ncbi:MULTISPECIES: serine--tRNA ligase [unclassified Microbacterium]|uniref:serine--tRNA ligase n=1 Tax=unclassified Microbacterium TaxID=2609290 RepID=UPI002468AB8C|nr:MULTISPECIES: serine--tRNA ligase [unclassified Microbacterium]MDH5133300.1 serine--tRNA ligase [Microbacterium sp. RD10]MDH5136731.1 serine--tRNA ligase [Microbacterium sp. RD11]MDH5146343.1 serine--tRNA ligase [Microbacterium sp. RD12]MDH5153818.1 serine--tRNA ligase [Microbacterium sp. RD06]MDH5166858.1 serine--tRNA ligase [Microbacterium sp. RD02]
MIDLALLRDNPEIVRRSQAARGNDQSTVDVALEADRSRRAALAAFEELRAEQNAFGKQVAKAPKEEKAALVAQAKDLADRVKQAQHAANEAAEAAATALARIENVVIDGVPAGGEEDFVELRRVGEVPAFDFEPRDHLELGEMLGAIDMERGAKVSGARFYFLRGIGARLEIALMNLALDKALQNGFVPLITPTLVRPEIMQGTGFLGEHADEVYHLDKDDDLYLVGTSEVALAGYHKDEIVDLAPGALRYAGWSTCYRREAGSHGKDTRGIIRVHQFNKLEMFVYTTAEDAEAEHLRLVALQEEMLTSLGLAYRVIDVAAGDLGSSAARKYDIEAWVPTQGAFRELTSTSNCTTFQARRLDVRYRPAAEEGGTAPKTQHVATLNGTLATTRWIVALLETHQQADGSVRVPEVLRPYLGGLEVIRPLADEQGTR